MNTHVHIDGSIDRLRRYVRVYIFDIAGGVIGGKERLWLQDGSFSEIDPRVQPREEDGILIPYQALVPLAQALADHLGKALPSQSEVTVLRESLDLERARVDRVLDRHQTG